MDSRTTDPGPQSCTASKLQDANWDKEEVSRLLPPRGRTGLSHNNFRSCRFYFLNDPKCVTFCPCLVQTPITSPSTGQQLPRPLPLPAAHSPLRSPGERWRNHTSTLLFEHIPCTAPTPPSGLSPTSGKALNGLLVAPAASPPLFLFCSKGPEPVSLSSTMVSPTSSPASYPSSVGWCLNS